jgi:hypothetical protein
MALFYCKEAVAVEKVPSCAKLQIASRSLQKFLL